MLDERKGCKASQQVLQERGLGAHLRRDILKAFYRIISFQPLKFKLLRRFILKAVSP